MPDTTTTLPELSNSPAKQPRQSTDPPARFFAPRMQLDLPRTAWHHAAVSGDVSVILPTRGDSTHLRHALASALRCPETLEVLLLSAKDDLDPALLVDPRARRGERLRLFRRWSQLVWLAAAAAASASTSSARSRPGSGSRSRSSPACVVEVLSDRMPRVWKGRR